MKNFSLSTALSSNHNWDPIYSMEITQKLGVKSCQIYIGNGFDQGKIDQINNYNLNIIFHSNHTLDNSSLDMLEISIIKKIKSNRKYVVYHHNPKISPVECYNVISELNRLGITPLLENFYDLSSGLKAKDIINNYLETIDFCNSLDFFPLIDFPRLFKDNIAKEIDPFKETERILNNFKNYRMYAHLIDVNNNSQNRESWCPIGSGVIPYNNIYKAIVNNNIEVPLWILEFEDESHILQSIEYINNL
ncbi:MAG: hypothetical protein JXR64_01280 [Spirochaetales bacterium]|nr:hypothetical protein [Spirochaetales bacterium]